MTKLHFVEVRSVKTGQLPIVVVAFYVLCALKLNPSRKVHAKLKVSVQCERPKLSGVSPLDCSFSRLFLTQCY